jgi:hypothetical protein
MLKFIKHEKFLLAQHPELNERRGQDSDRGRAVDSGTGGDP